MSIQHRSRGFGREYGETRPTGDELKIAYYRYFDSSAEFELELDKLRTWLGDRYSVVEVPCVSAYDEQTSLEEG